jgi:formate dehydrogenase subunit gamma
MPVSQMARSLRPYLAALLLTFAIVAGMPAGNALAQADGMSQEGTGSNPTALSVNEQQLFEELGKIEGRVTIPNQRAGLLEQAHGRDYRAFHEGALPWITGIAILGMLAILILFLLIRGRIRMDVYSGIKILRFNWFERFNHWMTATAFIVLALTGVNYVFGKRLLMPILGPDAFADWSAFAKMAHNFMSWPFMVGIAIMLVIWVKDNFPDHYDWAWLRAGGGFFNRSHPPAARFNAGQKLIFWTVILGGAALSASGIVMLFPFALADIGGMQLAQYIHAVTGVIMFAIILAHIYIGSIGQEGAFDAMGNGEVDLAWAEAHHRIWVEEQQAKTASGPQLGQGQVPAE